MTRIWTALVLSSIVVVGAGLLAHHSFAVYYIEADTIDVDGDVVEFQYKNPHSWIFVQGREGAGPPRIYAGEWTSVSQLERAGITKTFFKPGDSLRIWASPNRNPNDNRIRLKRIERRDGWKWRQGQATVPAASSVSRLPAS